MGVIPKDIDITVEAENGGIKLAEYIARTLNLREPVIFPKYGTAKISLKSGVEVKFVATRKERYDNSYDRNPTVSFVTLVEDIERRDFTVNSLLKNVATGEILDITGKGISDIKSGFIRTHISPDIIFSEDPLRMMRAIRFSVKYDWTMTDEVIDGIKRNVNRINIVSKDRIKDELDKIIKANKAHVAIPLMDEVGLLELIVPEMFALKGVSQDGRHHSEGDAYVHTLMVIKNMEREYPEIGLSAVWAAIAHDWGKKQTQTFDGAKIHFYGHEDVSSVLAEERMRDLKYPNEIVGKTKFLIKSHMRGHHADQWKDKAFRKFFREMGDHCDDLLALLKADSLSSIPEGGEASTKNFDVIQSKREEMSYPEIAAKKLPINGNDIISEFGVKGEDVGRILSVLRDMIDEFPEISTFRKEVVLGVLRSSRRI